MKDNLKLLRGVVRDTTTPAAFQHVRLYNGRAQASDGAVTLDVPFACHGLDVTVPGTKFITAMARCDAPVLKMMKSGRLQIKDGGFKVSLPLMDNKTFPTATPDGERFDACPKLLEAFKITKPFTGGERVWLNGVHIRDGFVYATNGFSMARVKIDYDITVDGTVPTAAVAKVASIREPITALRVSDKSVTFKLGDDMWLRSALITEKAPDMSRLIYETDVPVPEGLADAIEQLAPFFDGKFPLIEFDAEGVHVVGDGDASVALAGLPAGRFRADLLREVLRLAKYIDLSIWPAACPYSDGADVYGAIAGVAP